MCSLSQSASMRILGPAERTMIFNIGRIKSCVAAWIASHTILLLYWKCISRTPMLRNEHVEFFRIPVVIYVGMGFTALGCVEHYRLGSQCGVSFELNRSRIETLKHGGHIRVNKG